MLQAVEGRLAVGNTKISGDVVEGAAFHDSSLRVAGADVLDPLPCIAEHVEESIGAGLFLSHVVGHVVAVAVVPCDVGERSVPGRLDSTESGILPFGFAGETHADTIAIGGG